VSVREEFVGGAGVWQAWKNRIERESAPHKQAIRFIDRTPF
jgi:hypothetical protein